MAAQQRRWLSVNVMKFVFAIVGLPVVSSLLHNSGAFSPNVQIWSRNAVNNRQSSLRMADDQDQDIVEKLFSFFMGKKEEAPMGLRRMTVEKYPDQYPAVKGEFAEPVKGDSADMAIIRPLLRQTELERRQLKLAYDASKNGWNPRAFHKGVDKKGPGVVLARTQGGAVVGGYNPKGWVGYGELRPGISAFLFTWPDGNTKDPKSAIKLRKIGGAGLAVLDKPETGPFFGSEGFSVPLSAGRMKLARCKLGSYYERMADGGNSIFARGEDPKGTQLLELKAFVGVYEPGEPIPFDDAIPFSLT